LSLEKLRTSTNTHLRKTKEKREAIAKLLKEHHEWSNGRIADELGVDHKTVGDVRAELIATREIPELETTVGKDNKRRKGRKSPGKKPAMDALAGPAPETVNESTTDVRPVVRKPPDIEQFLHAITVIEAAACTPLNVPAQLTQADAVDAMEWLDKALDELTDLKNRLQAAIMDVPPPAPLV
jgi:hypothetical protein